MPGDLDEPAEMDDLAEPDGYGATGALEQLDAARVIGDGSDGQQVVDEPGEPGEPDAAAADAAGEP